MGCKIYFGTTKRIASVIQRGLSAPARLLFSMSDRSRSRAFAKEKQENFSSLQRRARDRLAANLGSEYAPWDKIVRPWDRRIVAALGDRTGERERRKERAVAAG